MTIGWADHVKSSVTITAGDMPVVPFGSKLYASVTATKLGVQTRAVR